MGVDSSLTQRETPMQQMGGGGQYPKRIGSRTVPPLAIAYGVQCQHKRWGGSVCVSRDSRAPNELGLLEAAG